jgi:uroporphyrin-III C-methyltransferase
LTEKRGKLYLIGAGPGDPELLTLRAVRALGEADVILYDRLVDAKTLSHARPNAEIVYVGKHHGEQERTQAQIFELIQSHARSGKIVARLKGGDPLVFGRGAEEWALALQSGMEVELIPGVSSAISVPGLAGIPLTYRRLSQNFAVITGHGHEGVAPEWAHYARIDTLVILMGVKNRVSIAQALIDAGRPREEPVAFVERGTTDSEHLVESTLGEVAAGAVQVHNPAVFVIGEVVRLRRTLKP